jgi:magnesium-transporting ATPase (P-type)
MVVENEVLPYLQWLWRGDAPAFVDAKGALAQFGIIALTVFVLALVGGFVVSVVRNGPVRAGEIAYRTLFGGASDLMRLSPRRVGALASLAIKESLRRRVWVSLVVFGLILLFASWYLGTNNREPARLYLSFVTTATSYLILLLSLVLAAFSLPADMKQKTLYTVVTKPVRPVDIVLGRIVGF